MARRAVRVCSPDVVNPTSVWLLHYGPWVEMEKLRNEPIPEISIYDLFGRNDPWRRVPNLIEPRA